MKPPTHSDYFKAWISYCLAGILSGAMLGLILGELVVIAHVSTTQRKPIILMAAFLLGLPLSYYLFRLCVERFIVSKAEGKAPGPT